MPTLIPSCEQVLSYYLRQNTSVNALVGDHVYTTTPKHPGEKTPMVILHRIGGSPRSTRPLWVDQAILQLDCYAGSKFDTETLAHTVRNAVCEDFPGYQTGSGTDAVITDVSAGALIYLPDEAFTPPKPRYLVDVTVTLHPAY